MQGLVRLFAAALLAGLCLQPGPAAYAGDLDWPVADSETKPWTRWWWHGSAVTKRDLTAAMDKYAAAGLGGVEITPIYGVRGGEKEFIEFLAPQWMDMLEHVLAEAARLNMGVDIATGTGWPFGGPWVDADAACKNLVVEVFEVNGGESLDEPVRHDQRPMVRAIGRRLEMADLQEPIGANADLQGLALEQVRFEKPLPLVALMAYGADGSTVDLTDRVGADDMLDWQAPPGNWKLYAAFQGWHGKLVERAGPGGEGDVLDHFSRDALAAYLIRFDDAFADRDVKGLRAFFNDSYEVDDAAGNADWTPRLLDEFQRRRGYDLREHLPALVGEDAHAEDNGRVLCDFRETLSDLLLEEFTLPWNAWAGRYDARTRNQAHGSPANILDLYAASDIPETEGTDRIQFIAAASAGHVSGKRLISAEAATWLDEHFLGTLAAVKRSVDAYFVGGVNHICYHGTCYSPESEPWPGRLFYAAVELQPTNPQWRHFHALNEYVTRCQSFLQAGRPDSDVLVYYPIHDEWAQRGPKTLAHFNGEMRSSTARKCVEDLLAAGYLVDLISDRQLAEASSGNGRIQVGSGDYRALVIPPCETMPPASLERAVALARDGAVVIVEGAWPKRAPGRIDRQLPAASDVVRRGPAGEELADAGVAPESQLVALNLQFIRRANDDGKTYFIVNTGDAAIDQWVAPRDAAEAVALFDPMTGEAGVAAIRRDSGAAFRLQLAAGESRIVRTYDHPVEGGAFPVNDLAGEPVNIPGPWTVAFLEGGPELPATVETPSLTSWTDVAGDDVKRFVGTARYAASFPLPAGDADSWILDLGEVRESAEVRLNGQSLGTLVAPPYQVRLSANQLLPRNTLEIEVANLMANRIADLDRRGVGWKKFYNVNMAPRRPENRGPGGLFDASQWPPLPSGLLGPVTLRPAAEPTLADAAPQRWQFNLRPVDRPFSYSVPLPEGNFRVTIALGADDAETTTTIRAEVRRLLAETIRVPAGGTVRLTRTVSVRRPQIAGGDEVRLKDRERGDERANWDDMLTLDFSGDRPGVRSLIVERDESCPTLFLIGDSTVSDQAVPPWSSWGQMLPRFFGPGLAVANHAESGESLKSALGERRIAKLYSMLKPGDWVCVQFGHNDMKSTDPDALQTFAADLIDLVAGIRARGATPILVTSMERQNGVGGDTLAGYPDAVRRVAAEQNAPLVDLHAMSKVLYAALGDDLSAAFQDSTHHNDFGSYELARCVVEGLRNAAPELARHLSPDAGQFDPAAPDAPASWGRSTTALDGDGPAAP